MGEEEETEVMEELEGRHMKRREDAERRRRGCK